jgi:glycosyltransferase involved in cell wall biosynthesis
MTNYPPVSVVIASMNEENGIRDCLESISRVFRTFRIDGEVVVADNSNDRTPTIAREFGVRVVTPDKLGYGNALIYGINQAKCKYVIIGDADNTYNFNDIPRLLEPLVNGEADMVIGSRFKGNIQKGSMPWLHQYIGNPLLTVGLNFKLGTNVSDAHSGIRSFTKELWVKIDHRLIPQDFCSELLKQAVKHKARISEIPVVYHPRKGKIKAGTFLHGWRCFKFLIVNVFFDSRKKGKEIT